MLGRAALREMGSSSLLQHLLQFLLIDDSVKAHYLVCGQFHDFADTDRFGCSGEKG
jgi:hypothetical protein